MQGQAQGPEHSALRKGQRLVGACNVRRMRGVWRGGCGGGRGCGGAREGQQGAVAKLHCSSLQVMQQWPPAPCSCTHPPPLCVCASVLTDVQFRLALCCTPLSPSHVLCAGEHDGGPHAGQRARQRVAHGACAPGARPPATRPAGMRPTRTHAWAAVGSLSAVGCLGLVMHARNCPWGKAIFVMGNNANWQEQCRNWCDARHANMHARTPVLRHVCAEHVARAGRHERHSHAHPHLVPPPPSLDPLPPPRRATPS